MLHAARGFIQANARLLERHLFRFHFEAVGLDPVQRALEAYRTADGLFGFGLEPDKRSPAPQPADQQVALSVLDEIGAAPAQFDAICDRLGPLCPPEGGLSFSHPSVAEAPHASWWACEAGPQPFSINPSGIVLAILLKRGVAHHWLEQAEPLCWASLENLSADHPHSIANALAFLSQVPDRRRAELALDKLASLVRGAVSFDVQADGYVFSPLTFAPFPDSPAVRYFSGAELRPHLEALAARQQVDGGWPINWPALSPAVEVECRGIVTLNALKTLRAYGVLPGE